MASRTTKKTRPTPLPEDDDAFVRLPTVLHVYPVGKNTWLTGVREGRFPKPVRLSARVSAWRVSDIRALLAARATATNDDAA